MKTCGQIYLFIYDGCLYSAIPGKIVKEQSVLAQTIVKF